MRIGSGSGRHVGRERGDKGRERKGTSRPIGNAANPAQRELPRKVATTFFFFFCRTLEAQAGGRGKDRGGLGRLVSLTEANEVKVGSSLGADAAGGRPDQPPQSHAARGMWYVASGKWHVA